MNNGHAARIAVRRTKLCVLIVSLMKAIALLLCNYGRFFRTSDILEKSESLHYFLGPSPSSDDQAYRVLRMQSEGEKICHRNGVEHFSLVRYVTLLQTLS